MMGNRPNGGKMQDAMCVASFMVNLTEDGCFCYGTTVQDRSCCTNLANTTENPQSAVGM